MTTQRTFVFPLLGVSLMLMGCYGTQTRTEQDFGTSMRHATMTQTLNPKAAENRTPVTGLDGVAARNAVQKYQQTFSEAPTEPAPLVTIDTQKE